MSDKTEKPENKNSREENKTDFIIYKIFIVKLNEICNKSKIIERKKLNDILGRVYHIPKQLKDQFITNLESIGLIKKLNRDNVIVLN